MAPSTIAHYRIVSKLGEGGMGAVYRATDTKLNRDVAIKVLPAAFAEDADRMARFTREAQVLASLNHPNIAAIYGVEQGAIVMELVEGKDLAGPLPIDTAIDYARQIAAGLEAAHEKGIVHRDLKPANIKVTPEGVVKLLDFGLAKTPAQSESAATLTISMTQAGMIVGTAGYMSPEQARGKVVDKRADIWAFGVVLFELLTGKAVFGGGETLTDVIAAVVTREPDWSALPEDAPPHLRRLLERCLRKDPKLRLRDIGDARIALDEPDSPAPVLETLLPPAKHQALPWILAAVLAIVAATTGWMAWKASRPAERPLSRFVAELGPGSVVGRQSTAAISPDGRRLAYPVQGSTEGIPQLATRLLNENTATVLPGTENAEQPFFSPDGQWIGFFADLLLKKISVHGGAAVTLCPALAYPRGAAWGPDGFIVASLDGEHLSRVPDSGGRPETLGNPDAHGERAWQWPQVIEHGRLVVFSGSTPGGGNDGNIDILTLKTGAIATVMRGGYFGRYLPSGHLTYLHQGTLFAVPLDISRLQPRGAAVPILDDVGSSPGHVGGQYDSSGEGTFVYLHGKPASVPWQLSLADLAGKAVPVWTTPSPMLYPKLSPDGKLLAGSVDDNIVVYNPERAATIRLSTARGRSSVWAPDGKHLVYSGSAGQGSLGIFWIRADGSSQPERLFSQNTPSLRVTSFSPDGRQLAFWMPRNGGRPETWILTLDLTDPDHPKPQTPRLYLTEPGGISDAAFSPDGRWIAYTARESGSHQPDVFVRPYPGTPDSGQWQISNAGGEFAVWSRKSSQLYYRSPSGALMAVDYRVNGSTLAAAKPRSTPVQATSLNVSMSFDLTPDGSRFLLTRPETPAAEGPVQVTLLLNFFDELKRRLP